MYQTLVQVDLDSNENIENNVEIPTNHNTVVPSTANIDFILYLKEYCLSKLSFIPLSKKILFTL